MSLEQTASVIIIIDSQKKHLATQILVHCSHLGKSYARGADQLDFQFHTDGGARGFLN